jgi:hypothetical protein
VSFTIHGPVDPKTGLFVGRVESLALMEEWLHVPRCVGALLGARQTGKTSLLLQLKQRLGHQCDFAFINLEAIESADADTCYRFIAEEVLDQLDLTSEGGGSLPDDSPSLIRFLRKLSGRLNRTRVCLLLDEIGALPHATGIRLAHTLRAAFTNRYVQTELGRYQFVVAGSEDLLELTTGRNSPLRNVTESVYLHDLKDEESRHLLRTGFAQLDVPLVDRVETAIVAWSSGHPYWTQLLGTRSAAAGVDSFEGVDRVARGLIETEDRNLPQVRRGLGALTADAISIVNALLMSQQVSFSRSDPYLTRLELLGIIKEAQGCAVIRNRVYEEALRAWFRPPAASARVSAEGTISPVRVFISYAHADEAFRLELGKHLATLERQGLVLSWHDRMIAPGQDWTNEIDAAMETSQVILLLISADFIQSRYCYEVELQRALERHATGSAVVIPVILRPVVLGGMPFGHLQSLPTGRKPVADWKSSDTAYVDIVEGVRAVITRRVVQQR